MRAVVEALGGLSERPWAVKCIESMLHMLIVLHMLFLFNTFMFNIFWKTVLLFYRHLENSNEPGLTLGGYFCPQCRAKYCELPVECKVCGK